MNIFQLVNPFYLYKRVKHLEEIINHKDNVISEFGDSNQSLHKDISSLSSANLELQHRIEVLESKLSKSESINKTWFDVILGFGLYENVLLNKSLWGHTLGLVEFKQGCKDERSN